MILKKLLALGLISGFAVAGPVFGQESAEAENWNSALQEIISLADSSEKISKLSLLLSDAGTDENRVLANYYLGYAHFEAGRNGSAIPFLETALTLSRDTAPQNIRQLDAIYNQLASAMIKAGRVDEATELGQLHIAKNDELLTDTWSKTETAMVQRRTALHCPHHLSGMLRNSTTNYRADGSDVSFKYYLDTSQAGVLTLYYTLHGENFEDDNAAHASAVKAMARTAAKSNGVEKSSNVRLDASSPDGSPVIETIFKVDNGYTGAWITIFEGWVLKTRVTWDNDLGESYGRTQTLAAFEETMPSVPGHFEACAKIVHGEHAPQSTKNSLQYLLLESTSGQDQLSHQRPNTECFLDSSNEGNAFISMHPDAARLYTIDGKAISGDVFVTKAGWGEALKQGEKMSREHNASVSSEYVLKGLRPASAQAPARLTIYKAYSAMPSAHQAFSDFANTTNGQASPYGHIEFNKDGGTNIVIDPSILPEK